MMSLDQTLQDILGLDPRSTNQALSWAPVWHPVFKIVHDESVKVYLPMYNGNVQQNPLCVESCVTKKFSTSPLSSSTISDPDANSVLLRAHLCPAVDSMRRKPYVRFFIKMQIQYSY